MSDELHKILNELTSVPSHRKAAAVIDAQLIIEELLIKAYRNGYNDNARDCYCWQTIPDDLTPHKHLLDDGESYDIRPNINKLLKKEEL